MELNIKYSNFVEKITNLCQEIFKDKYDFIYYDEVEEVFVENHMSWLEDEIENLDYLPLAEILADMVTTKEEWESFSPNTLGNMLSLHIEDFFIINEKILKPAGYNLFKHNYNQLVDFKFDIEQDTLTCFFED